MSTAASRVSPSSHLISLGNIPSEDWNLIRTSDRDRLTGGSVQRWSRQRNFDTLDSRRREPGVHVSLEDLARRAIEAEQPPVP